MTDDASLELTFVLVNFQTGKQVVECLRSLQTLRDGLKCEFVVVDNSPPECSRYLTGSEFSGIRVITNSQNLGYAAACNLGLRASRAPYVFLMNPDVRYSEGSARDLVEWLNHDSSVALVGPRILNLDGTRQFSCRSFPNWTTALAHRHSLLTRYFPANRLTKNYLLAGLDGHPSAVDWASGCCLLVRKKVVEELGGLDEGFFLFFEDVDLAYRVRERGSRCVYYPGLTFTHTIGASRANLPDQGMKAKHLSAARYFTKNVIHSQSVGQMFRMAVSVRSLLSEFYHRRRPKGSS